MFLLGGPAFSGKTLLAHLLNQSQVTCLDEPGFHDVRQQHRGVPVLQAMFPDVAFPEAPDRSLTHEEAIDFLEACEHAMSPRLLGMKTSDWTFISYARSYKRRGYPVIALIRDIRDTLAEAPLPEWVNGEAGLNDRYRLIWQHRQLFDLLVRYEDLVADPAGILDDCAALLSRPLALKDTWPPESVQPIMIKLPRHELLASGVIARTQVGVWRTSPHAFTAATLATVAMTQY